MLTHSALPSPPYSIGLKPVAAAASITGNPVAHPNPHRQLHPSSSALSTPQAGDAEPVVQFHGGSGTLIAPIANESEPVHLAMLPDSSSSDVSHLGQKLSSSTSSQAVATECDEGFDSSPPSQVDRSSPPPAQQSKSISTTANKRASAVHRRSVAHPTISTICHSLSLIHI